MLANFAWPLLAQARMSDGIEGWGVIAIMLAAVVLPWLLGIWVAKALRLPDYGARLGVVFFAIILGLTVNILKWPPRYGVDLSGGVNLIYEVDESQRTDDQGPVPMDQLVAAVTRRVNPGGLKEVVVRPYGERQVEIIIPKVEEAEVQDIEQHISNTGSLEFRILASRIDDPSLVADAEATTGRDIRDGNILVARWVPLDTSPESQAMDLADNKEFAIRTVKRGDKDVKEILVKMDDGQDVTGQYLTRAGVGMDLTTRAYAVDFKFNSDGADRFARLTSDNQPDEARNRFKHLAVLLNGAVFTAPTINSVITDSGQITSPRFTDEKPVRALVDVLNAGSLPTALKKEPVSRRVTGPLLGEDSIRKGGLSIVVSTAAVLVFMLVYYRFAGVIACCALVMNVLLTVGVMTMFNAAFTLPGLAGLVLTVGMAVDANVLIYERMREEQARGATLRMAIRNGFDRAWTAIFDSNVTTLITAVILFFIGTDQVKGFATTLFIGVGMSMFTAIYCSRVAMEIAERKRWLTKLTMTQIIGQTHFDFVRWMRPAMVASAIVIAAGLVTVVQRGKGLLDIDFTGGVSVEAVFQEPLSGEAPVREAVREVPEGIQNEVRELIVTEYADAIKTGIRRDLRLASGEEPTQEEVDAEFDARLESMTQLPDASVSSVTIGDEPAYKRFLIDTSNPSIEAVEAILTRLFDKFKLEHNSVEIGQLAMITADAAKTPATTTTPVAPTTTTEPAPPVTPPANETSSTPAENAAPSCGVVYQDTPAESGGSTEPEAPADPTPAVTEEPAAETPATPAAPAETPPVSAPTDSTEETTAAPVTSPETASPETPAPAATTAAQAKAAATTEQLMGGTEAKLKFSQNVSAQPLRDRVQSALDANGHGQTPFDVSNPQLVEGSSEAFDEWTIKLALPMDQSRAVLETLSKEVSAEPYFPSSSSIGGQVAANTQSSAIMALLASLVAIAAYLWVRFQRLVYGVAAVVALVHDVLIALVALSASYYLADALDFLGVTQFKINLPIIAAFLTIIGFSINDTIVIFDRMREVRGKSPRLTADMVNLSLNQTLSRTILTSLTVFITVIIMYALGGQGIHGFAFAMLVGVISGTYSTVYIAAPLVLWLGAPADVENVSAKREPVSAGR